MTERILQLITSQYNELSRAIQDRDTRTLVIGFMSAFVGNFTGFPSYVRKLIIKMLIESDELCEEIEAKEENEGNDSGRS